MADKRLLVLEGEFASVLKRMKGQGNSLSPVMRNAWDSGKLRTMVKGAPQSATGAHITVVAHITADELHRLLDHTEVTNGLVNRFLFCCAKRSKALPHGGGAVGWADLPAAAGGRPGKAARTPSVVTMDAEARTAWEEIYPDLIGGPAGVGRRRDCAQRSLRGPASP